MAKQKINKDLERIEEECASNEYILLYMPKHPTANKAGYVPQHRYVVERDLGRYLLPSEVVHHKDLDKTNNDRDNLLLFDSQGDHVRFHNYNYPSEDINKLLEEGLIVENANHAHQTIAIDKYKCICKFCGDTFTSETKHNNFCSRICARNAQLGNELPTKEQLLDWLNRGYSKYKIIQMLEVTENTIDAYFAHYDINYKPYLRRNKDVSRDLPLERYDKLSGLRINIRENRSLDIAAAIVGMENFIDWLINNRYTTSPNTKDGRNIIRNRVYQGLYKKRTTIYSGLIIDSPNVIAQLNKLRNKVDMPFSTQEQYNKWVEMFYLMHHSREVKMERYWANAANEEK